MPRRIVIHMGFHKTGTSSVQQVLRDNRKALRPHMRSLLRWALSDVVSAARGYSMWRDPVTLLKFNTRFARVLADLPAMPKRVLCLSAEELAGHLPGRDDMGDYSAAPVLAAEMADSAQAQFPRAEIVFYLSTRAPDAWIESAYWQHVKSSSLTLDFDAFCARYPDAATLDSTVTQIARAVPCAVHHTRLEDTTHLPLGPATPVLNLCEVPAATQATLTRAPAANTRPDMDVLARLLEANRTITDAKARKQAKDAILHASTETSE